MQRICACRGSQLNKSMTCRALFRCDTSTNARPRRSKSTVCHSDPSANSVRTIEGMDSSICPKWSTAFAIKKSMGWMSLNPKCQKTQRLRWTRCLTNLSWKVLTQLRLAASQWSQSRSPKILITWAAQHQLPTPRPSSDRICEDLHLQARGWQPLMWGLRILTSSCSLDRVRSVASTWPYSHLQARSMLSRPSGKMYWSSMTRLLQQLSKRISCLRLTTPSSAVWNTYFSQKPAFTS